eukprot:1765107-Prymnesium_polylepis.1
MELPPRRSLLPSTNTAEPRARDVWPTPITEYMTSDNDGVRHPHPTLIRCVQHPSIGKSCFPCKTTAEGDVGEGDLGTLLNDHAPACRSLVARAADCSAMFNY